MNHPIEGIARRAAQNQREPACASAPPARPGDKHQTSRIITTTELATSSGESHDDFDSENKPNAMPGFWLCTSATMSETMDRRKKGLVALDGVFRGAVGGQHRERQATASVRLRSSGRGPLSFRVARSRELASISVSAFTQRSHTVGIVGVLAHVRRIVPAALAFRAVGAPHCNAQARQCFRFQRISRRRRGHDPPAKR